VQAVDLGAEALQSAEQLQCRVVDLAAFLGQRETGASIVEVTIAMVVFIIIMVAGVNYYFLPQATIGRQKTKRLVVTAARDRMEKLIALQYAGVTPDSNETNTPVTVGNTTINRTTTITEVDDAADGLGGADADSDTVDYKLITVAISWNDSAQSLSFSTIVSIDDSTTSGGGGGLFAEWGRKCELVIQSSQVPDTLTNFPVLLTELTLPSEMLDADGSYPALNGGGDIRFSSDAIGSTRLSCEIVTFTTDNNPANGTAEIWVDVPTVLSSSNTSIWVWYDSSGASQPAASAAYGSESVWDANYKGVWHLNESGNGTADEFADATSNANHGQGVGGGSPPPGWSNSRQNIVFYNGSNFFLLYTAGDGNIYYKSSSDNVTWSGASSLVSDQHSTELDFDIYLVDDTKLDLAYVRTDVALWASTAAISGTTITAGSASLNWPGAYDNISIARTGAASDRVYLGAADATNSTDFWFADQTGDITGSTTWGAQSLVSSAINLTLVPYQDTDKVLAVYTEDAGGPNNDGAIPPPFC